MKKLACNSRLRKCKYCILRSSWRHFAALIIRRWSKRGTHRPRCRGGMSTKTFGTDSLTRADFSQNYRLSKIMSESKYGYSPSCMPLIYLVLWPMSGSRRWRSWLGHGTTNWKAVSSIFDWIIGIFHWHKPSGRTNTLGSTQYLTEMSAWQGTFFTQMHNLATRLSSFTTATTGQTTIGSGTQSDLLMMGIKMHGTCWDTIDYQ